MKSTPFSLFFTLFIVSTLYLPRSFAQNDTQSDLPEGAKARINKDSIRDTQYSRDGATLSDYTYWVTGILFSPDGKTLATTSPHKTIHLWDANTGEYKKGLNNRQVGNNGYFKSISFSPDARQCNWRQNYLLMGYRHL